METDGGPMAQTDQIIDVANLIEIRQANWFRISIIVGACAIMVFEGYDMLVVSYAAPFLIKSWHANRAAFGQVIGVGLAGYMLGATVLSHLGDRFGRKISIIGGCLLFGIFTFSTGYSTTLPMLAGLRFAAGIGLGVSIPNTIALAAEYSASEVRAFTIGCMFIGYNIGGALGGLIAARYVSTHGWPILFHVGGIAPIILAVILIFALPESVRFLALKQDRPDRVAAIVSRLAPEQTISSKTRFVLSEERHEGLPVKRLFTDGRATMTTLLWLAFVASLVGHYFLTSWLPTVLAGNGVSMARAVLAGSLFQIGGGFGNLIVTRLLDKRGIMAIAGTFAIATPLTVSIGFAGGTDALLMVIVFLAGACVLGGQVGLNAVSGIVYPTYIRSTGTGWAFGVGRIGSILGPVLGGILINRLPTSSLFVCAAIPMLCCAGAAFFLGRAPGSSAAREAPVLS
jgi:MFS transporter, AAHS family, 4-hydroxybenzoate transporter